MMEPRALDEGKRYKVGVIGNKTSLMPFWELFVSQGSGRVLAEMGLVAAALPGDGVPGEPFGPGMNLPVYSGFQAMLAAHPEINLVLESTGDQDILAILRRELPAQVALVERDAAGFFVRLLTTEQMWVACKVDLMHTQTLLKSISDQLSDEIFFLSPQGHVLDVNETVCRRLNKCKKDFTGKPFRDIFFGPHCPPPDMPCETPFDITARTGEPSEAIQTEVDDTGRMRYYRIYTYPIFDGGTLVNVVAMRRDITKRTEMEQRLQQSEKLASIGQLSTYIAHEIRNPLFAISGFANSLLRQGNQDQASREKLGIILEESKRLDTILKSIINFSRPTEGRETVVDLNQVVAQTIEIMRGDCERAGAMITFQPAEGLARAKADPELIKQCLINLLKNAVEAMPDGGDVAIRTGMTRDHVTLEVRDSGQGIAPELRDKVFSPFFSTKGKGSGLGLAMIRKIMDDIGGNVDLQSKEGEGTAVTLLLPPALATQQQDAPPFGGL
ncbi:two-component system sensor histidine kinase NtrB [Desulfovibrio sp.]